MNDKGGSDSTNDADTSQLGRGHHQKRPSILLRDFITHTVHSISPSTTAAPSSSHSSGTPYPISCVVNCDRFSVQHRAFIGAVTTGVEPRNFSDVVNGC